MNERVCVNVPIMCVRLSGSPAEVQRIIGLEVALCSTVSDGRGREGSSL